MKILNARAAEGAFFLDQIDPGWTKKITLTRLDLNDPDQCVWGQVFRRQRVDVDSWPEMHGFALEAGATGRDYAKLTTAWISLIRARRTQQKQRRSR